MDRSRKLLAFGALYFLLGLSCSYLPHTPEARYQSDLPYKLVYVHGEVFLKFTGADNPPFGPFWQTEYGDFRYEEPPGYIHSVSRFGESWHYSHSYVHMASEPVDASELVD